VSALRRYAWVAALVILGLYHNIVVVGSGDLASFLLAAVCLFTAGYVAGDSDHDRRD
jgi:hypothetical protein